MALGCPRFHSDRRGRAAALFCRVLVIPGAVVFLWSGASDPLWLSLVVNPDGQWRARRVT